MFGKTGDEGEPTAAPTLKSLTLKRKWACDFRFFFSNVLFELLFKIRLNSIANGFLKWNVSKVTLV